MAERRRILITDDEALFRTSAAESLRARFRGVEVLEAEDGAEALAIISRSPVDVLITDLQMPNLGGIEVVARVSSHRMPVQIIVVSAHITDQTRVTLDELGALVWIDKPIDLELLHQAVERMLSVPRAHVSGVTLTGFVQLLDMERQTCALRVSSRDGVGTLVFEGGQLRDAWTGELAGDAAALSILRFRECTLDVIGAQRTETPRVTLPLSFLLLESARRADEEGPVAGQWEIMSFAPPPRSSAPPPGSSGVPSSDPFADLEIPSPKAPRSPGQAASAEPAAASIGGAKEGSAGPQAAAASRPRAPRSSAALERLLGQAMKIEGALGVGVADVGTGESLGTAGSAGFDLAAASSSNAALIRANHRVLETIHLTEPVEDVLVTLTEHLHLIRPFDGGADGRTLLVYLALDRARANVVLARRELTRVVADYASAPKPVDESSTA